jgi:hypothetical protein
MSHGHSGDDVPERNADRSPSCSVDVRNEWCVWLKLLPKSVFMPRFLSRLIIFTIMPNKGLCNL